jgi:flagellar basal body-associated protein FliL
MESQVMLGILLFVLIVVSIGAVIKHLSKPKNDITFLGIDPVGTHRPSSATKVFSAPYGSAEDKFGRFKVTLADGSKKTIVGNLKTILEVNSVKDYYEIK